MIGFTGSAGNEAEKDYIGKLYDTVVINAPKFLNCLKGH
jgi:hypothetical protein